MFCFLPPSPFRVTASPRTKRPPSNRAPRWRCATSYSKKLERTTRARELSDLLTDYARAGDGDNILRVVQYMENTDGFRLNAVNYSTAVSGLGKAGRYRDAFDMLAKMRDICISPTPVTLRIVTRICLQCDKYVALDALDTLVQWWLSTADSPDIESWRFILFAYAQLGDVQRLRNALALRALGIPPKDTYALNVLLGARGMSAPDIFATFGYMLCSSQNNIQPDVISYNALLRAALADSSPKQNSLHMCRAILASMKTRRVIPDAITWTSLSKLLVHSYDSESLAADPILRNDIASELRTYWDTILSHRKQNPPDRILYNAMIAACATVCLSASATQLALEIITDLTRSRRVTADIRTVNSILACISRAGILNAGTEDVVMNTMGKLDSAADQYTYCSAISTCISPQNAVTLLRTGAKKGVINGAMVNAALKTYGDDINAALKCWKSLRQEDELRRVMRHVQCYEGLLRVCGRAARPDVALKIVYVFNKEKLALGFERKSHCNLIHSFYRGAREFGVEQKLQSFLSPSFVNHMRLACNCSDMTDLENIPIERVRIKY